MKHIKGLDTLRAFAVFFVIIQHFGVWFDYTSPSGRFITNVLIPDGGFGVHLFFVLSGFLITSILFNAKRNVQKHERLALVKNFFIRRALRIFPIYYLLLFFLWCINYPDIKEYFWYFATYTSNILCYKTNSWNHFSHTWTLSVEEQFYLLWPWLMVFVNDRYIKYVLFASIATGIISAGINMELQTHIGPMLVSDCFDAFGLGALYAWARLDDKRCKSFQRAIKTLAIAALTIYFYRKLFCLYGDCFPPLFLMKTVDSIISLALIILVVNNRSVWVGKYLLGNKVINYIGKISYGLYLFHFVYIQYFCNRVNMWIYNTTLPYPQLNKTLHDSHVDYWIQVSIMIGIAALSFRLIEMPILKLKKHFNYTGEKRE